MRTGIHHYALKEWGLEEYSSIEEEISSAIDNRGGSASIDDLVAFLSRFGVAENSVRTYANGSSFVRIAPGLIRNRTTDDSLPIPPPIEMAKGCYKLHQGWALRLTVTRDMLRGSGTPVPIGFVGHLGVHWQGSRRVPTDFGGILVSWGSMQASIGSLRDALSHLGAVNGDHVFVVDQDGEFTFQLARTQELEQLAPADQIAHKVGCAQGQWGSDVLGGISQALGFSEVDCSMRNVLRRLGQRGEDDLIQLLEPFGADIPDDRSLLEELEYILRG